jgi:hypothetical protein
LAAAGAWVVVAAAGAWVVVAGAAGAWVVVETALTERVDAPKRKAMGRNMAR